MPAYQKYGIVDKVTIYHQTKPQATSGTKLDIKKVAAYCRVSTDLEIQKSSLELQMETYNKIIQEHSGWELAGIYADKGLSGTRTTNRPQFNHMIEDARAGKVNVILAKSLSRFARNTVDALQFIRELKQMGVTIYFEKEKINTNSVNSEFLLTIFAAFAQEESHSISENTKRGIRNKFRLGQPRYAKILGYNNQWEPNDDAWIVEKIFNLAFDGKSKREIAAILNEEGVTTKEGKRAWNHSTILGILRNEKYTGSVLMQKTFTSDHMQHNKVYNRDLKIDSYYIEQHHQALVNKELFEALSFETNLKRGKHGADQTPYYGMLKCPQCGRSMIKVPGIYAEKRAMWVCPGENIKGTLEQRRTCEKLILYSTELDKVIKQAIEDMEIQPNFKEAIACFKDLINRTERTSYCRIFPLISSMTIEKGKLLVINWKMGWQGKYPIHPVKNAKKQWTAIAKAHIENLNINGIELHKVNHPFRKEKK